MYGPSIDIWLLIGIGNGITCPEYYLYNWRHWLDTRRVLLEEHKNFYFALYFSVGLVEYWSFLRLSDTSCLSGSHWLAFLTEKNHHIVPFWYHFYTKVCFYSCSSCVHLLVLTICGFLGPLCSWELNSTVCRPHLQCKCCVFPWLQLGLVLLYCSVSVLLTLYSCCLA